MSKFYDQSAGFILPKNLINTLSILSDEQIGQLFRLILFYVNNQRLDDLIIDPIVDMAFRFIKEGIDQNIEKYESTCRARSAAGKKSASVKKERKTEATSAGNPVPETSVKDTVYEGSLTKTTNVDFVKTSATKVTDNVNENDYDIERDSLSVSSKRNIEDLYSEIVNTYNELCPDLKPVNCNLIGRDYRQKTLLALKHFTKQELFDLFAKANSIGFLRGEGPNGWTASFDWLINVKNLQKVKDGGYFTPSHPKVINSFNDFKQRKYDFQTLEKELLGLGG